MSRYFIYFFSLVAAHAQTTILTSDAIITYTSSYDEITDERILGGFQYDFAIDDDETMYIAADRTSYSADISGTPPHQVTAYIDEYTGTNGISEDEEIYEYLFNGQFLYAKVGGSQSSENFNYLVRIVRIDVNQTPPTLVDVTSAQKINKTELSGIFIEGDVLFYDTHTSENENDIHIIQKMNLSAADPGDTIETVYTSTNDDILSYTTNNDFLYTIEEYEDPIEGRTVEILKTPLDNPDQKETLISWTTDASYDDLIIHGNHLFFVETFPDDNVYVVDLTASQLTLETFISFSDGGEGPFDPNDDFIMADLLIHEEVLYIGAEDYYNENGYVFAHNLPEEFTLDSNQSTQTISTIYPNPAKEWVVIEGLAQRYQIYNLMGQELLSGFFVSNQKRIDVSKLDSGVYLVKIDEKNIRKLIIED